MDWRRGLTARPSRSSPFANGTGRARCAWPKANRNGPIFGNAGNAPSARVRPRRPLQPAQDVPRLQALFGLRSPQADRGMKMLAPANLDELLHCLAGNHAHNEKFPPFTLTALNRVVEHAPEDLTVVVE